MSTMLSDAVALTESGVLVNGLSATDLLSGFQVNGEHSVEEGTAEYAGSSPDFRGSGVPLSRLEAVRELVAEVLDERAADPELTSANPAVRRTVFPWGIGIGTSDVVVVGPDKEVTAAYLRMVGLRARTVDATEALRIAGDLAAARSVVAEGALEDPELELAPEPESEPGSEAVPRNVLKVRRNPTRSGRTLPRPAIAAAVGFLVTGVAAVAVAGMVVLPTSGTADTAAEEVSQSPEASVPAPSASAGPEEQWRELTSDGGSGEPGAVRPEVTVTADVPGWQVTDSSGQRDIWTSEDPDMRVLTAAAPTPVGTQAELDSAMLAALEESVGAGDVVVTARSPVDYVEVFPESTTTWRVRLIDGHQVSVGCQYRQESAQRLEVCDRFTSTARVR